MTIRFKCKCGRKFEVADNMAGRKARCTDCGLTFLVPTPKSAPSKPAAQADDNPLAQAARAAQASRKAHAAAAQPPAAAAPAAKSPRPAAPASRPRPARPPAPAPRPAAPAPRPPAPADDDVPVARLATPRAPAAHAPKPIKHLGAHKPKLTAVQTVAIISILVAVAVVADALITMLSAMNRGAQGLGLIYGVVAILAGVGIVTSLAAASGSRFCIGVMLGGAGREVLQGVGLMYLGFTKAPMVIVQGANATLIWGVAGIVALLLGVIYLLLPLLSRPVRKYTFSKTAGPIVGMVLGFILGPAIASTALPAPDMVKLRAMTVTAGPPGSDGGGEKVGPARVAGGKTREPTEKERKEFEDNRALMEGFFDDIHKGLVKYERERSFLPSDLGLLVDHGVHERAFFAPSNVGARARRNEKGHFIDSTDVIYLFTGGRTREQIASAKNADDLIVAHSGPDCEIGDGVLVVRLPGAAKPVEWLTPQEFDEQLKVTRKWLQANPAKPEGSGLPEKLPGWE